VKKLLGIIRNIFTALGAIGITVLAVILGLEKGDKNAKTKPKPLDDVQADVFGDLLDAKYPRRGGSGRTYED
jgi:hypothetical protein